MTQYTIHFEIPIETESAHEAIAIAKAQARSLKSNPPATALFLKTRVAEPNPMLQKKDINLPATRYIYEWIEVIR